MAFVAACSPSQSPYKPPPQILTLTCTIGISQSAANITVRGAHADAECDASVGPGRSTWYLFSSDTQSSGAVICQLSIDGFTYTVRDGETFHGLASAICGGLERYTGTLVGGPSFPNNNWVNGPFVADPHSPIGEQAKTSHSDPVHRVPRSA